MAFLRAFVSLALLAALFPAAVGASVKLVARDEPVPGTRASTILSARPAPLRFNMVGLHWQGSGEVWFRTALAPGDWTAWQPARPEGEDRPDAGSPEAVARRGWKLGNPYWTGPARDIEYRTEGEVTRLRAHFLWSEVGSGPVATARASTPPIIRRAQWGADESIVAPPWYADRLRLAIVHHTAGANDYSRSQSAAIVRGIQRYHVLGNGWNDIGYNLLVDKYGQVFEGRAGGIDRPVGGAHAAGFNTGSAGIAVLGTYSTRDITADARSALVKLISWRLDVAHVDPVKNLDYVSFGSDRFPAGTKVRLRAVSGHRDMGFTSCPGNLLYGRLGAIAKAAASRDLPKLYEPSVTGGLGGLVRIRARLSGAEPWTVTIRDASGATVASGSDTGSTVDWTWDASAVFFGDYTYSITGGSDLRGASGRVPGPPALAVRSLGLTPRAFTPNGDGVGDATKISFSLTTGATVTASVVNEAGVTVARPVNDRFIGAGAFTKSWNGTGTGGVPVPDGPYTLRVEARSPVQQASASKGLVVDRTLGALSVSPAVISPNGDARADLAAVGFILSRPADVTVEVKSGGELVAGLATGPLAAGSQSFGWNGLAASGSRFSDGRYKIVVRATTALGSRTLRKTLVLDTAAPGLSILSASYARRYTSVRFALSEPATLVIRLGDVTIRTEQEAGTYTVSRRVRAERVRIKAWDAAFNVGRASARVR